MQGGLQGGIVKNFAGAFFDGRGADVAVPVNRDVDQNSAATNVGIHGLGTVDGLGLDEE